jgi:hypothetical protein
MTKKTITTKGWVNPFKYAKIKKVSPQTIYRWIRERKIPEDRVRIQEVIVKRKFIKL